MRRWRFWRLCRSSFRERTANSKSKDLRREHGGKPAKDLRKIAALTPQALRTQRKPTPQKTKHREIQLPRLPDSVKLALRRDVMQRTLARARARGRGAKKKRLPGGAGAADCAAGYECCYWVGRISCENPMVLTERSDGVRGGNTLGPG